MGLSIGFNLEAPPGTDKAGAKEIIRQLRRRALRYRSAGRVDEVFPLRQDESRLRRGRIWRFITLEGWHTPRAEVELAPLEGFVVAVEVGEDCEALWLGLCRYPLTMLVDGRRKRTGLNGWRWEGFCKTQYSSLHGWTHFRRCHLAVLGLLDAARRLGCRVTVSAEGEYWLGRNEAKLRQNVEQMNCAIAGAAGARKEFDKRTGAGGGAAP